MVGRMTDDGLASKLLQEVLSLAFIMSLLVSSLLAQMGPGISLMELAPAPSQPRSLMFAKTADGA